MIEKGVNKMDFQSFVDNIDMPCCVLSVEKRPDGKCGEIRIVVSNKPYKDVMGPSYYDNRASPALITEFAADAESVAIRFVSAVSVNSNMNWQ